MKDAILNIRIPEPLKNKFIEIANKNNETHSSVLRQLIKFYIYRGGKWKNVQQKQDTV